MTKKSGRMVVKLLAALICICICLGASGGGIRADAAMTASQSNINKLKENLKKLNREKTALEKQQSQLESDRARQLEIKESLDKSIALTEDDIATTEQIIAELGEQIKLKEADITQRKKQENEKYEQFKERVRIMCEDGEMTYFELILSSKSLSQMLTRMDIVSSIVDNDRKIMSSLAAARENVETAKKSLEADKTDVQAQKSQLDIKKAGLKQQYANAESLIKDLTKKANAADDKMTELEKKEAQIAAQVAQMAAELARKQSATYVGGTFSWPLPGYSKISSYFSMRVHPITGVYKQHTGIDIPAPRGTKIVAANGGTVLMAHYNTAYGNMVTINHGGGYVTLYGHMTKSIVKVGQKVKQGETIGYVGSTGYSTGPHLHFEIQKNGTHQNPLNYYEKK